MLLASLKVPTPNVDLTTPGSEIVGQSLILECSVTTVRGITSRVDIVWSSDDAELRKSEGYNTINATTRNSVVYIDTYLITQLNTTSKGQQFQCKVVINGQLLIMASDIIVLDVSGEIMITYEEIHIIIMFD